MHIDDITAALAIGDMDRSKHQTDAKTILFGTIASGDVMGT
jgi:hypothetical protein